MRLDTDRQKKLEPKRIDYCKQQIEKLGYTVNVVSNCELQFEYKGQLVKLLYRRN